MTRTFRSAGGWVLALSVGLGSVSALYAADRPKRFTIWDIHLGDAASAIPDEYVNYACGTSGGPPSIRLGGFADFRRCKPDAQGLREVYFEYDDELEYEARALENRAEIRMYAGTTAFEFPIVASALFDDAGRVRGLRMVTDPRQDVSRSRIEFWELANFVRQRFGDEGWNCTDLPLDDGESPAGSRFIKNRCEKIAGNVHLVLEQRFFQKKGQQFIDPESGKPQPQAFESATRFEMFDATAIPSKTSGN